MGDHHEPEQTPLCLFLPEAHILLARHIRNDPKAWKVAAESIQPVRDTDTPNMWAERVRKIIGRKDREIKNLKGARATLAAHIRKTAETTT